MSLHILPLASWHRAVFLLNSRTRLFVAAADRSGGKPLHRPRHPFSLSYGVNLPSSLTWFLSRTSGFSPHPPVSVLVRMPIFQRLEAFLVSVAFADSAGLRRHPLQLSGSRETDLPVSLPTAFDPVIQHRARIASCVPPSLHIGSTGILTCHPSTTPFGLALGSD